MRISRRTCPDDAPLLQEFYQIDDPHCIRQESEPHIGFCIKFRHSLLLFWHLGSVLALLWAFIGFILAPVLLASAQELHNSPTQIARMGKSRYGSGVHSHTSHQSSFLISASYDAWIRSINRRSPEDTTQPEMCLVLNEQTIKDMCRLAPRKRLERFRKILLFPNVTENSGVYLFGLFLLHRVQWKSVETDLQTLSNVDHLREGVYGRDCVVADAGSQRCTDCFKMLLDRTQVLTEYFDSFNASISQFDCSHRNYQRFSANSTCEDCLAWYQRWLLLSEEMGTDETRSLWTHRPCPDWCEEAELSCPHLSSTTKTDYAGLPTFRCTEKVVIIRNTGKMRDFERWTEQKIQDLKTKELMNHRLETLTKTLRKKLIREVDPDERNDKGETLLISVIRYITGELEQIQFLNLLLREGADPNLSCKKHTRTPLMYACIENRPQLATVLIQQELTNLKFQDRLGNTALMYAAMHGQEELVNLMAIKLTRRWGFDVIRVKNLMGYTAEKLALKNQNVSCAKLLERNRLQMLSKIHRQMAKVHIDGKTKGWRPYSSAFVSLGKYSIRYRKIRQISPPPPIDKHPQ